MVARIKRVSLSASNLQTQPILLIHFLKGNFLISKYLIHVGTRLGIISKLVVSLSNLSNMLICANNNQASTSLKVVEKKFVDPFENYGKRPSSSKAPPMTHPSNVLERKPSPFEGKPIKVAGRKYKSIDAFLDSIKLYKNTHTENLTSEMKKEVAELYERAHKKGIRFMISCAFVTQEENQKRKERSEAMGHKGMVSENSLHLDGRAVDLRIIGASSEEQRIKQRDELIAIWRDVMKHRSGADFPKGKYEPWHFDLDTDPELKILLRQQKKIDTKT